MIDALATQPHYRAHLLPIWEALPEALRGRFLDHPSPDMAPTVMVAGYADYMRTRARRVIFVEHGAGQTYGEPGHPCYSGGRGRERVALFICPSQRVAHRNTARYPSVPAVAVGGPNLDRWHAAPPTPEPGLVGISFHWPAMVAPESRGAMTHYLQALEGLGRRFRVLGHAHPRIATAARRAYEKAGIPFTEDFAEVMDRCAVYAVDNSSTLYEFASTDRPVVVMDAPWYRRGVEHGLRFWEHADVGVRIGDPQDLGAAIEVALMDAPEVAARRRAITAQVYAYTDGHAAERAARAIAELPGEGATHGATDRLRV